MPGQPGCALRRLVGVLLLATLLGALVCLHAAADELADSGHPLFSFHQTMALALQVVLGLTLLKGQLRHGLVQPLHEAAVTLHDFDAAGLVELLLPAGDVVGTVLGELRHLKLQPLQVVLGLA
jgi:hypothetical protein